jgi:hypothetical protein
MKIGRAVVGAGNGLIDRVLCVLGAIGFSQLPEFMQQYVQRLGGHLDEARRQVERFEQVAQQSGLTLDRLIGQTSANSDAAVAKLGAVMTDAVSRVESLSAAQSAIQGAAIWQRPFVFFAHLDRDIARATWSVFKPAVPTTAEGAIYAIIGIVVLLSLYHGAVRYPISTAIRARRNRSAAQIA